MQRACLGIPRLKIRNTLFCNGQHSSDECLPCVNRISSSKTVSLQTSATLMRKHRFTQWGFRTFPAATPSREEDAAGSRMNLLRKISPFSRAWIFSLTPFDRWRPFRKSVGQSPGSARPNHPGVRSGLRIFLRLLLPRKPDLYRGALARAAIKTQAVFFSAAKPDALIDVFDPDSRRTFRVCL